MRNVKKFILCLLGVALGSMAGAVERQKLNFNGEWRLHVGDVTEAAHEDYCLVFCFDPVEKSFILFDT